jgi:hypothetical protein
MALFCESSDEKLTVTGLPIGLIKAPDGSGELVLNFLTVTTGTGDVLHMEHEGRVGLSKEMFEKVGALPYDPKSQLSLALEKAFLPPEHRDLTDVMMGDHVNFYQVKSVAAEPDPLAALR